MFADMTPVTGSFIIGFGLALVAGGLLVFACSMAVDWFLRRRDGL